MDSYRGVTLSSVVTKLLEFLILERLQMVFLEVAIPHHNQPDFGILHYIWVHSVQMGSNAGHGSKSCPLCDENNLAPISCLLRAHQHEIGLDRTPLDSVDQLLTQ